MGNTLSMLQLIIFVRRSFTLLPMNWATPLETLTNSTDLFKLMSQSYYFNKRTSMELLFVRVPSNTCLQHAMIATDRHRTRTIESENAGTGSGTTPERVASFVLRLQYDGKKYKILVGKDAFNKSITAVFKEMRDEYVGQGFMNFDADTLQAINEKRKEIVIHFVNGPSFVRYNKARRDTKAVSEELLSLVKDMEGTMILDGKVEITDTVAVSNDVATLDI